VLHGRLLATETPDTEGEDVLPGNRRILALIRPGGRFLHGRRIALGGSIPADVMRHTTQNAGSEIFYLSFGVCRTRRFL